MIFIFLSEEFPSFPKKNSKNYFRSTIRVSNSLDPDKTYRFVNSDLGSIERISADELKYYVVKFYNNLKKQ